MCIRDRCYAGTADLQYTSLWQIDLYIFLCRCRISSQLRVLFNRVYCSAQPLCRRNVVNGAVPIFLVKHQLFLANLQICTVSNYDLTAVSYTHLDV